MSFSPDVLSVGLRALGFVALFQAAGAALYLAVFGRWLAGSRAAAARLGCASACVGIALLLAHLWLDAARMAGNFSGLIDRGLLQLAWSSSAGLSQRVQLAGLAVIAVALAAPGKPAHPVRTAVAVGGALIAIGAFALTGHTSEHPLRPVLASLLLIHLVVVAFWFGALWPLRLVTRLEVPAASARVVRRFSTLATWLVPLIAVAGLGLAALLAGHIGVVRTPYGELLLGKLGGFLLLLVFAAYNKWHLTPALGAIAAPTDRAEALLRRSMAAEYLLIVTVLCATAVLTTFFSPT